MITYRTGNILDAKASVLVNTVNTVGVMGKGIALQMKNAFSENFKIYSDAVKRGEIRTGQVQAVPFSTLSGVRYIVNFPMKIIGAILQKSSGSGRDCVICERKFSTLRSIQVRFLLLDAAMAVWSGWQSRRRSRAFCMIFRLTSKFMSRLLKSRSFLLSRRNLRLSG
ncbi:hypothetical protein BIU88_12245 [Chlorobaculum limnaeum]|uniref:Macro domain-containing protein n=1 Tax=Chlorobaculum limnaeum TaxID=274537 RepID=A0A1D8D0W3_CHLLM|nr:macro domain-containing protein [Chlorobaculum limnaeum]AOS84830.1 hypothetical protein BIU88_12245 [Chlorobaculum limnaeum]